MELTPWSGPMAYNQRASQCKSQVRGIVMSRELPFLGGLLLVLPNPRAY